MNNTSVVEHPDSYGFYYDESTGHFFPIFNPPLIESVIVSVIGFLFCTISLILYLAVCHTIYRNKSGSFSNAFYTLILHLSVPDCLYLFIQIIIGYPVPFFGFKNVSHSFVAACGFLVTVTSFIIPALVIVIGVNRYVALCKFEYYTKVFKMRYVHLTCLCCWMGAMAFGAAFYACTCHNYKVGYAWKYSCSADRCAVTLTYMTMIIWAIFTGLVPIIYCLIFCHYKIQKNNRSIALGQQQQTKMDKRDINMLFQFGVISGVLLLNFGIFWGYGRLSIRYGDVLVSAANCLNSAVNPYLYLYCSSEIRKSLKGDLNSTTTNIKTVSVSSAARQIQCIT